MPALSPPVCNFKDRLPAFRLVDFDGTTVTETSAMGRSGLLVAFICNHCPYVKAILPRFVTAAHELIDLGINVLAISSNDVANYPEDSPEKMQALSKSMAFGFPYLYDETQEVARAFDAICTPDFFGYNINGVIQYRGRFDASRLEPVADAKPELLDAMKLVVSTGEGPQQQFASIGCSLKWKT